MIRILFIENSKKEYQILKMVFPEYRIIHSESGENGIELVRTEDPDIVILNISIPDMDGIEVIGTIISLPFPPPIIAVNEQSDIPVIVDAIKAGAVNFIQKPYNLENLNDCIRNALGCSQKYNFRKNKAAHPALNTLIGESRKINRVKELISKYAKTDETILLSGESGTGKDLVSTIIHTMSNRNNGPYCTKNCGAIPLPLVETEIFGSEKGAFTNAVSRPGSFENTNGGTLFLDEIGEMEVTAQVKLLRVLEEKMIVRIGGTKRIPIDVRIISATNKNLKTAIADGGFRMDLFYRLNLLHIELPALREREEDIPLLIQFFLKESQKRIDDSAMRKLKGYPWPGNIRELQNVIRRAELLSEDNSISCKNITF